MKSAAQTLRQVLELGWPLSGADAELEALRELLAENERLRDLVVRFRQWDDLPGRADGPFWMSEADKVLGDA